MSGRTPFQYPGQDPLSKRLTALVQYQEGLMENELKTERSPDNMVSAVRKGQELIDSEIERLHVALTDAAKRGEARLLDCKPGCVHCCKRAPEAVVPEVLAAVQFVENTFSPLERAFWWTASRNTLRRPKSTGRGQ